MRFYRLATEEDFDKAENRCEELPLKVRELIRQGDVRKAILKLRELKGIGIYQSKENCHYYAAIQRAREDFHRGKPVYTEYE